MSFIRQEAKDVIWQWREAIAGLGAALLGLWMGAGGQGIVPIIGAGMMVAGIALSIAGWQRARFRRGRDGAGVVQVTEGQITYFGPFTGGAVATSSISEVWLVPDRRGPIWQIEAPRVETLHIPVSAEGAEALFDVFGALPGLDTEAMLAALDRTDATPELIWTRRLLH